MKFYINQNETETRGEAFTKLCNQKSVTQTIFTKQVCAEGLPLLNRSLAFTIEQNLANIPIIIIAGTRSDYLMRCVYNLIRTPGVLLDNVYIVVDGFYQDVLLIAQVFGVRAVFFPSLRDQLPGQPWDTVIKVHVSRVWSFIFLNTSVDNGIILEEDLLVSPDFFSYFSQLVSAIATDPSLFCASAWNDNGYIHTTSDPARVYRTEFFPGLGYLFPRRSWNLVKDKIHKVPIGFDWWLRYFMKGQGLECVIPDFSRTYHYGISGTHMNRNFHNNYFIHHRFNTIPDVKLKNVDKLKKNLYELELFKEFKKAKFLSKGDPCEVGYENFVPNTKGETYVIWFAEDPIYQPQQNLLRCWGMMDDYLRCLHNGILFFYIKDNFIMVVSENSNYAKKFKTENIPAVHISNLPHTFPVEFRDLISVPEKLSYYEDSILFNK